jgi:hypothetical protein
MTVILQCNAVPLGPATVQQMACQLTVVLADDPNRPTQISQTSLSNHQLPVHESRALGVLSLPVEAA